MHKFLKTCFLFFISICGVFIILNLFQSKFNNEPEHYSKQYLHVTDPTTHEEGIIIGNSHAAHSLQPSELDKSGISFYNYALNGASPEFYYNWYNTIFIEYKGKPKYCIYSIDFLIFDKKKLWRKFEHDSEHFTLSTFLSELFFNNTISKKALIINRFPFLKYKNFIVSSILLEKGHSEYNVDDYDRGYISYTTLFDSTRFQADLSYRINQTQLDYLTKLLSQMKGDGTKVIFIRTPEFGISKSDYQTMKSLQVLDSIAETYDIPLYDINTEKGEDFNQHISNFSSWGYTNHQGARMFSEKVAKFLRQLNLSK